MKLSYVLFAVIIGVLLYLLFLYFTIRSSIEVVSTKEPYATILGETIVLERDVVLAKNLVEFSIKEPFFLTEDSILFEGVLKIGIIKKGTNLKLLEAYHQYNGVSGSKTSILVGSVFVPEMNKNVSFEYSWGDYHGICLDDPCNYWTFPRAIWQIEEDDKHYFID